MRNSHVAFGMFGDGAVLIATYDVELGFHSPGLGALPRRLGVTKRVTDRAKSSPKTVTPVTEVKPSQAAPIRWRVQPRDHHQHDSRCSRTPGECCGSTKAHGWSTAGGLAANVAGRDQLSVAEKVGAGNRSLNAAAAAWAATWLAWDENRHGFAIGVGEKSSASMRPNTAYKCSSVRSVV